MTLNFCEKCSGILVPRIMDNETLLLCNRCGWFKILKDTKIEITSNERVSQEDKKGEGVASKQDHLIEGYHNVCKKCGHEFAEILDAGIRISDEDNLILLRCLKCGASLRIGRKTT
jgi:DNA-directed RNA polymerase subunit M/transcription elongation factor TFIIS